VAHLGYLHEEFVSKRRWLDDATFGLLQWWKAPPWLVVILAVTTGQWGLR
jgi:chromate transport protein ChrA